MTSSKDEIISSSTSNETKNSELAVEQITTRSSILSRLRRNAFIITTIILFIAFLVLLICFIVKTCQPTGSDSAVCTSVACVKVAAEVASDMDVSVDPCGDFFNYACGGWKKVNDIPDTEYAWNQVTVLDLRNKKFISKLVSDREVKAKYKDNEAVMKTFMFYGACMNKSRANNHDLQPLLDLIEKLGSWNLSKTSTWEASSWDLIKTFANAHMYSSSFFKVKVQPDFINSSLNVIMLVQGGLELTKDTYLQNITDYAKIREAYKKLMIQIVGLLGAKGDDAKRQMMDVYDLETKLANITVPLSVRRNYAENYKKITVKQLTEYTKNTINLKAVLQAMFKDHITITNDSLVASDTLEYLRNVCQLIKSTPTTTVANYMMWRVVLTYKDIPSDFIKIVQEFNEVKTGTKKEWQQWRKCLSYATSILGMPLGLLFIDERFTEDTKLEVQELMHEIHEAFITNLDVVDWMDESTKSVAKEKIGVNRKIKENRVGRSPKEIWTPPDICLVSLKEQDKGEMKLLSDMALLITTNIGYPSYIKNKTALAEQFHEYQLTENVFENVVKGTAFLRKKNLARITQSVDRKEWLFNPQTVNAYYSVSRNNIGLLAGILQPPLFDKNRPRALNYGGLGVIIGHEITHGFDDNGRRFNKDGNRRKWWSNHSIDAFKKKTNCLVEQYSQYKYFGENIKGDQTLGENIADNGGLKQAYQAYQNIVKRKGHDRPLPGINLTNDQLFFLGFAQALCGKHRRQAALVSIENGHHTIDKFRAIGSVSNSGDFAKAYKCAPGTKMNPTRKCRVW